MRYNKFEFDYSRNRSSHQSERGKGKNKYVRYVMINKNVPTILQITYQVLHDNDDKNCDKKLE